MLRLAIATLWLAWAIYWMVPRASAKPVRRRESGWSRLLYWGPAAIGAILLVGGRRAMGGWQATLIPHAWQVPFHWLGLTLVVVGLGFTVWARVHLAGNWSGRVTLKEGHELVRTGPYAWARHPIYTGLLLAFLGTTIAAGRWEGLVGFVLIAGSFIYKLRLEERWLTELFPEAYPAYRARVRALIPGFY